MNLFSFLLRRVSSSLIYGCVVLMIRNYGHKNLHVNIKMNGLIGDKLPFFREFFGINGECEL